MPSSSGLLIRPSPPPSDTYADLALQSMQRILDSFDDVQKFGMKVRYVMCLCFIVQCVI